VWALCNYLFGKRKKPSNVVVLIYFPRIIYKDNKKMQKVGGMEQLFCHSGGIF
jgi:hypothetical protein